MATKHSQHTEGHPTSGDGPLESINIPATFLWFTSVSWFPWGKQLPSALPSAMMLCLTMTPSLQRSRDREQKPLETMIQTNPLLDCLAQAFVIAIKWVTIRMSVLLVFPCFCFVTLFYILSSLPSLSTCQ